MDFSNISEAIRGLWYCLMEWMKSSTAAMDLQTAVICAVVFIFSAIVVYLISVFGMRERTYEEAIEEQRRRNKEAVQLAKHEKNRKDKKFKKWRKKSNETEEDKGSPGEEMDEKGIEVTEDKQDSEVQNFSAEIETKPVSSKKKRKRKSANKDAVTQPSSSEDTDEQHSHPNVATKPMNEISEEKLDVENIDFEDKNNLFCEQHNDADVCEGDKSVSIVRRLNMGSGTSPESEFKKVIPSKSPNKKNRKHRSESSAANSGATDSDGAKVMALLKHGSLSEEELNLIFDALSNKQGGAGVWTMKNDPVPALKKQIQEKEEALEAEQKLLLAANENLKNMRQLSQEKSRAVAAERSLREKVNQQQQEIQDLHGRLQMTHEQHIAELQTKMQQVKGKMNEEHNLTVQRLKEEISQLQAVNRRESEKSQMSSLEVSRLQHEIEQLVTARDQYETHQAAMQQAQDDLHHQIQQLEKHIEQLVSSHQDEEFSYKQRINDMSNKLQQADKAHTSLVQELQNAQSVCSSLESDNNSLRQQLDETKHQISSLEQHLIQLQTRLEDTKNMEVVDILEHQKIIHEKDEVMQRLLGEVDEYRSEMISLTREVEDQKQNNQEIIEKCQKANEALRAVEQKAEEELKKVKQNAEQKLLESHEEIEKERSEMQNVIDNHVREVTHSLQETYVQKMGHVQRQFEILQKESDKKFSHEREATKLKIEEFQKTFYERVGEMKAEADSKIEKAEKAKKAAISALELLCKQAKQCLQKLFPDIVLPENLEDEFWLMKFQEQALKYIRRLKEDYVSPTISEEIKNLKEQLNEGLEEKSKLRLQAAHYKDVLAETEAVLFKLQNSLEKEEKNWKEELSAKEKNLKEVLCENKKLASENKIMEANLEQLQGLREMQSELIDLQSKLQMEEEEKMNVLEKYGMALAKITELQGTLQEKDKFIEDRLNECAFGVPAFECTYSGAALNEDNSSNLPLKTEKRKKPRKRGTSGKK